MTSCHLSQRDSSPLEIAGIVVTTATGLSIREEIRSRYGGDLRAHRGRPKSVPLNQRFERILPAGSDPLFSWFVTVISLSGLSQALEELLRTLNLPGRTPPFKSSDPILRSLATSSTHPAVSRECWTCRLYSLLNEPLAPAEGPQQLILAILIMPLPAAQARNLALQISSGPATRIVSSPFDLAHAC